MKTALITGASTGLGFELSKLFAADGYGLVLTARNLDGALDRAGAVIRRDYGGPVLTVCADLTRAEGPWTVFQAVEQAGLSVDELVNNAGSGICGGFIESSQEQLQGMISLNVTALTTLTRLFLPGMVARGTGCILNLSSVVAFQPDPYFAVYGATKAYVLRFTESLRAELAGAGVSVTAFCPGSTKTQFSARAGRADAGFAMDAAQVAAIGYRGMHKGRRLVIPGLRTQLGVLGISLLPPGIKGRMVCAFQKKLCKRPADSAKDHTLT